MLKADLSKKSNPLAILIGLDCMTVGTENLKVFSTSAINDTAIQFCSIHAPVSIHRNDMVNFQATDIITSTTAAYPT